MTREHERQPLKVLKDKRPNGLQLELTINMLYSVAPSSKFAADSFVEGLPYLTFLTFGGIG